MALSPYQKRLWKNEDDLDNPPAAGDPYLDAETLNQKEEEFRSVVQAIIDLQSAMGYTNEQAQDAAAEMLMAGAHTAISFNYVDGSNRIDATVSFSSLAAVARSGNYIELLNKPDLKTVALSGSYLDLSDKPGLSAVALSGSYNDLGNRPSLAPVAISGSYNDLLNKPISTLNAYDYGARGDCYQPNKTIATTAGSAVITTTVSSFPGLTVGMVFFIEGQGAFTVQSFTTTTITLTSAATATTTAQRCYYGTDNTTALNNFFLGCLNNRKMGVVEPGRYLITGTIGLLEPGTSINTQGTGGLSVLFGGAVSDSMRLAKMLAGRAGTSFVWAGATGGTMMQFSRTTFPNLQGGFALVGMASSDPSGSLSVYGNKPGLGFHFSQADTPYVGTGYLNLDSLVCSDMSQAMQFGSASGDNNCDTSVINQLYFSRCDDGLVIKHLQGLSYRFNWIHGVSVPGSVVRSEGGGAIEIGSLHASLCGTATVGSAGTDKYILDCDSTSSGYVFKVALMRIENGSVRAVATRSNAVHIQIGLFEEANITNTKRTQFYQAGGTLHILGGRIFSYYALSGDERTIQLNNDASSLAPRFILSETAIPTPAWTAFFVFGNSALVDVSVINPRTLTNVVGETRHTRMERGRVVLGGPTTDAATSTTLDPMMRLSGQSYIYSYGPRVPIGTSIIRITVVGDRASNTPSVFKRRITFYRASDGTVTVVNTETIGTDIVQGTDQIASIAARSTYQTLIVAVKGTASTTINWRAVVELEANYSATVDY